MLSMPALAMLPTPDNKERPETIQAEWPIGQIIPSDIYAHTSYSDKNTFAIGEIVAIPNSHIFGTKEDLTQRYGKIIDLDKNEIIVRFVRYGYKLSYVTDKSDRRTLAKAKCLLDLSMKYPEFLGKFPPTILEKILKTKK